MQGEVSENDGIRSATHDITVVPIEIELPMHIGFKEGLLTPFGSLPSVTVEKYFGVENPVADTFPGFKIEIKDCVFLENPDFKGASGGSDGNNDDDDDDFDEDEDEEEESEKVDKAKAVKKRKLKV